jgi:uncharacterized membrane protein
MTQAHAPVVEKWEKQRIRHVHRHKPVVNINKVDADKLTTGQRIADQLASVMGSWSFIIVQSILLAIWICANVVAYTQHWDPYPFILLNLALSFQAAYAAPIIMMSQNRQATKDRLMAEQDYDVNLKAEEELKSIMSHLGAAGRGDARHTAPNGRTASGDPRQIRLGYARQQSGAGVKKRRTSG